MQNLLYLCLCFLKSIKKKNKKKPTVVKSIHCLNSSCLPTEFIYNLPIFFEPLCSMLKGILKFDCLPRVQFS